MKSNAGSESNPLSFDYSSMKIGVDCPNCGGIGTLSYKVVETELSDVTDEVLAVEGMVCDKCEDLFMDTEEGSRFLNEKAKLEGAKERYMTYRGEIISTTMQ